MADRLRFQYIRISKLAQVGEIAIDVLNPTDTDEIMAKLKERDFVEMLPIAEEHSEEDWSYRPIPDDLELDRTLGEVT